MTRRLLVVGLDGYEASLGSRLMHEGKMPALARLVERGAQVHLDHDAAKRTGLAWEHFSTGLDPAAAQRWSAVEFDAKYYRCRQIGTRLRPFTGALGADTVVFDAPYFDLGRTRRTKGIVGWGAHDPGVALQSKPRRLLTDLERRFGPYPAKPWIYGLTWQSVERTRQMGEGLAAAAQLRAQAAEWLLKERLPEWTLGIVVVSELHSASEALWHGIDAGHPLADLPSAGAARKGMEATYEAVDRLVGALGSAFPDTGVLVCSMHGMGPNRSDVASMALLPELMYRRRFTSALLRNDVASSAPIVLDESDNWSTYARRLFPAAERANGTTRPRGLDVPRLRRRARGAMGRLIGHRGAPTGDLGWMPATWYTRHWPNMDAFALPSFYDGQIRLNLRGREALGRVAFADYEATCRGIEDDLRACVDPVTGKGVVREIIRTGHADPRTFGPTEADLVVVWEGASCAFEHPVHGSIGPLPYRRPGGHTGDHGIAILAAAGIRPGFYGTRSAFDVVPTICDYATGRVASGMSGKSFVADLV